jgi:hypothetical protein
VIPTTLHFAQRQSYRVRFLYGEAIENWAHCKISSRMGQSSRFNRRPTRRINGWRRLHPPALSSRHPVERGWLPQPQMLDEVVDFPGPLQFVLAIDMDFVGLVADRAARFSCACLARRRRLNVGSLHRTLNASLGDF